MQKKKLVEFLETQPLLAFDYDGTLAPIVSDAERANLRPLTRKLLKKVCQLYPCVLMTGRAREDVMRHVKGIPFVQVLGNHGAEWGESSLGLDPAKREAMIARVAGWRVALERDIASLQGVRIEDKRLSLTVHYRNARRKKFTRGRVDAAISGFKGMRVIGGKQVYNLLPREIGGKGKSLIALKKLYGKQTAVFCGDDLNDEEVFELPEREQIFKVRVGRSEQSLADYFLPGQEDIDWFLAKTGSTPF